MYHWIVNMRLQAILECFIDDVIRSQNKSKLWTTIALSKFELEKRSTAQNVPNWTGYQKFKFQFHIQISKFWQVSNLRLPFHSLLVCNNRKHITWTWRDPLTGPPSHWSPISLVPHLISTPTHQSPISLVPQLAPIYHPFHWPPISLVPRLIGPPSHWSPSHWSPNS